MPLNNWILSILRYPISDIKLINQNFLNMGEPPHGQFGLWPQHGFLNVPGVDAMSSPILDWVVAGIESFRVVAIKVLAWVPHFCSRSHINVRHPRVFRKGYWDWAAFPVDSSCKDEVTISPSLFCAWPFDPNLSPTIIPGAVVILTHPEVGEDVFITPWGVA